MRKYLKPALEIEAFDVEDVITASGVPGITVTPGGSDGDELNAASAPIEMIELN